VIQPFPTAVNFMENPRFDVLYNPDPGIFQCQGVPTSEHVVHWWGNRGTGDEGYDYYPIYAAGIGDEQLEFETDNDHGIVIHFREPREMGHNYVTYRRSTSSCPNSAYLSEVIYPGQWEPGAFELWFWAKGTTGAKLKIRAFVSADRRVGSLAAPW